MWNQPVSKPVPSDFPVEHQPQQRRFISVVNGSQAELTYVLSGESSENNRIDFDHTYVPFRLRGKGVAETLVEAGLGWAREQGYEIDASCWYVQKFLADAKAT
jgi:uncharacterized protein